MIKKYCRAYNVKDLRQFEGWTERKEKQEADLSEDDVVYLWDDFTVVRSPIIPDKGLIFDTVTAAWQDFCKTTLHFEIPEDLHYAYEQTGLKDQMITKEAEEITSA